MRIGGFQKISLIDYPGRISAIVFTQGCNFRCPYCHNPELVDPAQYGPIMRAEDVYYFLEKRRGKLEAVSVTGGEPTLQEDLNIFLSEIKAMGYLVKVDTNGSNPGMLEGLIRRRLVDYVAMDVKGPLPKYAKIAGASVETENIRRSIKLIASSSIQHEFRTTVARSQLDKEDLIATAKLISKGLYILQPYVPSKCLDYGFRKELPYPLKELTKIQKSIKKCSLLDVVIR